MVYAPVSLATLKAIDLDAYGLGDFCHDGDGDGIHDITALHLVIYAHTVLQQNDWDDVRVSGDPGAIFFEGGLFGFADCNLNYYVNGEYPAVDGWGVTMDQCVLSPGDFVDFAAYSSWSFFGDSASGFHYFMDSNQITHAYEAVAGQPLTVKLGRTSGGLGGETLLNEEPGYTVFYDKTLFAGNAASAATNDYGEAELTFAEAGTYYLWVDGAYGNEDPLSVVSSPAFAKATVTAPACDHRWTDATCKDPKTCSVCGETEGEADPEAHSWANGVCALCEEECAHQSYANGECTVCGKAKPVTIYTVTLPEGDGYTVRGETSVTEGENYTFTVAIAEGYETGEGFAVKANGAVLTAVEGVYTIENITADQIITIEGVAKKQEEPTSTWQEIMVKTKAYLIAQAEDTAPVVDTFKGEWMVLGLARAGVSNDSLFFDAYYENVKTYVSVNVDENGRLHTNKSTDNSRVILALTALGKDVTNIVGHDLLRGLSNLDYVKNQGP